MAKPFVPFWTERLLRVALQHGIQIGVRLKGRPVTTDVTWATGPVGEVPGAESPCVKVSFPMPHGCTTVILQPQNLENGGLRLASAGKRFGQPGTYRLTGLGDRAKVAYIPMHERLDLWTEDNGEIVRCDHHFALFRFEFLVLKYRMQLKS